MALLYNLLKSRLYKYINNLLAELILSIKIMIFFKLKYAYYPNISI